MKLILNFTRNHAINCTRKPSKCQSQTEINLLSALIKWEAIILYILICTQNHIFPTGTCISTNHMQVILPCMNYGKMLFSLANHIRVISILLQLKFTTYCIQSSQKITLDNARATFLEDLAKPSNSLQFSLTAWLFHFETIFTTRSKIETSLHITCHQEWVEIQLWFKTS